MHENGAFFYEDPHWEEERGRISFGRGVVPPPVILLPPLPQLCDWTPEPPKRWTARVLGWFGSLFQKPAKEPKRDSVQDELRHVMRNAGRA